MKSSANARDAHSLDHGAEWIQARRKMGMAGGRISIDYGAERECRKDKRHAGSHKGQATTGMECRVEIERERKKEAVRDHGVEAEQESRKEAGMDCGVEPRMKRRMEA